MEFQSHKHIIVSGDTGNALGIVRALAEGGIQPILIYLEEEKRIPCLIKSKYLDLVHIVSSYEEAVNVLIQRYGQENHLPFVYTCDDFIQSIIDKRYDELVNKFYFFNAGEQGRITHLMDKHNICMVAERCGCRIPKQEEVDKGDLPKTLQYPVITKAAMSIMGAWKMDVFVCNNEDELLNAYSIIQSPRLLLQEYIPKKNELALQGLSIDGGREVYIPYGISFFRSSSSAYGHYMFCKLLQDNELITKVTQIIKECNYTGCFEAEFIIDQNDQLWFLEVNFRYSFWNYAVTFGGVNYPLTWAKAILSNHIVKPNPETLKSYFTALDEPGDYRQSVATHSISFKEWLKDVFRADMLYFYNPKDFKPAWSYIYHTFKRKIFKK